ncbi:MAG: thiamine diphosphokinase [Aquihabitans sp.]
MNHYADPSGPVLPGFVVVLGGGPVSAALASVPPADVVVTADSGLEAALAAGLRVAHVVGDFDSVDPDVLAGAEASGSEIHRHPADKDATDSELALRLVTRLADAGAPVRVFTTTAAGRFDHLLSDVLALGGPTLADLMVTGFVGDVVVTVVRPGRPRKVMGRVGEQVSLVPVHGSASGVSTEGLRWPLADAGLHAGTSRGVSNELAADQATVSIDEGVLLVVQPGTAAPSVVPRTTGYDPSPH